VEVITDLLPVKRGDPGCPFIPISIDMVDFLEALCDFGSSVNIMPMGGHSLTPRELSSTLVLPRSIFTSREGRRHFPYRTRLHKSQSNPNMNQGRGPTGGTGTRKYGPSQLRWSLQFKEVKTVDLSHCS